MPPSSQAGPRLEEAYGAVPLHFEPNRGQSDPRVEYLAHGRGFGLYLTGTGATLVLGAPAGAPARGSRRTPPDSCPQASSTIRLSLEGGNATPAVIGLDRLAGTSSYFLGNDPSRWITAIPTFGRVACKQVYPGVDMVYYGDGRALEYDFLLAAGTNPRTIRLRYDDGSGKPVPVRIGPSGDLLLPTPFGRLVQHVPAVFQVRNGAKIALSGRYEILGPGRVGLVVSGYDPSLPLTIDPILSYSTYLGGSGQDQGQAIAVDASGDAYVTGYTQSTNFPASNASIGGKDAFVTKLSPDGKSLVYSVYFGGTGDDIARGIALDAQGDAFIVGGTTSFDLPVLNGFQSAHGGSPTAPNSDAFIAELGPGGTSLVYSSYLGGSGNDEATAVALDAAGNAFITGDTYSTDFPPGLNPPDQPAYGGAGDAFLCEVAPGGGTLLYSSYLGGELYDYGTGIAVDGSERVYVTGGTSSLAFPIQNPYQSHLLGSSNAFVSVFDFNTAAGALPGQVVYSTYLGGSRSDAGQAITADAAGDAYVTGYTTSTDFPVKGAFQTTLAGGPSADAFVTELDQAGTALVYSTYLGGSLFDAGYAIAVGSDGSAYVTGDTYSTDFPTAFPVQATNASASTSNSDAFVSKLSPSGSVLSFSTYLGGGDTDQGRAIAIDGANGVYVAGTTYSTNFRTQSPFQPSLGGASDAFVSKILLADCTLTCTAVASTSTGAAPLAVAFSATSSTSNCGSGTVAYDWDFGDGSPHSSAQNPDHTYTQPGTYTWTVTASLDGITSSQSYTVDVSPGCTVSCSANETPKSGPVPLSVAFSSAASSSNCDGAASYLWDFDDGKTSTDQNPSHIYYQPGTYNWTMTATIGGSTCSKGGTVTALATPGSLSGMVAISAGDQFFSLDGPGIVSGTVTAVDSSGATTTVPISSGHFSFTGLTQGSYQLTATVTYTDNVLYDADLLSYGCTAPSNMQLQKTAVSAPVTVNTSNTAYVVLSFPPPLVMIHGMFDCYQKWYDPNASDSNAAQYWDNDARARGLLSFTPNYAWWGGTSSWPTMADEVAQQIGQDLSGLTSSGAGTGSAVPPVPTVWIADDMGGLVARVLASGDHRNDALVQNVWKIYLLGVPNSGTNLQLAGSDNGTLSTDTILRRFNAVYPDFGSLEGRVYAIAGDSGLWGLQNDDGLVSLASAFTISRELCTTTFGYPVCQQYPAVSFAAGTGHIFDFSHSELGSPASTQAIFEGVILPGVAALAKSGLLPEHVPESPAGSVVWGTTSRTSGTKRGRIKATLSRSEAGQSFSYPFTIGETDGMALLATVTDGSADFQVLNPTGQVVQSSASVDGLFSFSTLNPPPGTWTLVVTPGSSGVSFTATAQEDSPFGIRGSLDAGYYLPGSTAVLRVDLEGSPQVTPQQVSASLYDTAGNLIEGPVTLYDDGQHEDGAPGDGSYGALLAVFPNPGDYPVVFTASGAYQGEAFSRLAFATLTVVPSTHLLTGAFAFSPVSASGGSTTDAIQMTAGVTLPAAGSYALSADLVDAGGLFVAHASTALTATAAGFTAATLVFPLDGATCSQLDAPLTVAGLQVLDGATLTPEDVWGSPIYTPAYPSGTFSCQSGTPEPTPTALQPSLAVTGTSISLLVAGTGFQSGATLAFDSGIQVNKVVQLSQNLLSASITILSNAAAGGHTLTVTNPNGTSGNLVSALTVTPNQPPTVSLLTPAGGTIYTSSSPSQVSVSASASDDIGVTQVVFLLDGAPEASVSRFPFIWSFDSSVLTHGAHTLAAVAYDTSGLTAQASVTVYKDPPTVTAIGKLTNPFRLKVTGTNFLPGLSVTIGNDATPWSGVTVKSDTKLILKKGAGLKALFPKGQAVTIRIAYPDGTEGTASYTRP